MSLREIRRENEQALAVVDAIEYATALEGTANPFLDTFLGLSGGRYKETYLAPFDVAAHLALMAARHRLVSYYSWAVPDDTALEIVGRSGDVVEIGAGGGYWAGLLRARGVNVAAYDKAPAGNFWVEHPQWSPVVPGGPHDAARHPDATLFLCWPPYGSRLATVALYRYLRAGGRRVAYVGEHDGCCADERFFEALEQMRQVEEYAIPQFTGMHDWLGVWELA